MVTAGWQEQVGLSFSLAAKAKTQMCPHTQPRRSGTKRTNNAWTVLATWIPTSNLSATSILGPFWTSRSFSHLSHRSAGTPDSTTSNSLLPFATLVHALSDWELRVFLACPACPVDHLIQWSGCEFLMNPFLLPFSTGHAWGLGVGERALREKHDFLEKWMGP